MKVSDYMKLKLKLNNKGYMLVEIILASAIAFGLAFFIIDLTIKLKNKNDDLMVETLMNTDRTIINNKLMSYAKEEEGSFNCGNLKIDKTTNTITYNNNVIDTVNAYGIIDWNKKECSTDNGKISIKIPITIPQMPDKEYDIIFDYKYQIGDMIPPTISFSGCGSTNSITITANDTGGSGFDYMNVSVFKGSTKDTTKSKTNITSTSYKVSLDGDGTWTVYAQAYDKAGNRQSQSPETSTGWYYQTYTISTPKTGSYFIKNSTSIDNLSNDPTGNMYRYQGTHEKVTNNYICFGTNDLNTCTKNPGTYMYRIIGIDESGRIKIIKKEALDTSAYWHEALYTDEANQWGSSSLFADLNGDAFLKNKVYIPSDWSSKIETYTWRYVAQNEVLDKKGTVIYEYELGNPGYFKSTVSAKIGLMYMHDYYLALADNANCGFVGNNNPDTYDCQDIWIHLSHNDSNPPKSGDSGGEWTMSASAGTWKMNDIFKDSKTAWYIGKKGSVSNLPVKVEENIRPVFFLKESTGITSGSGKSDDPYIIGDQQNICEKKVN